MGLGPGVIKENKQEEREEESKPRKRIDRWESLPANKEIFSESEREPTGRRWKGDQWNRVRITQ
jgi:hypothetical protein